MSAVLDLDDLHAVAAVGGHFPELTPTPAPTPGYVDPRFEISDAERACINRKMSDSKRSRER